MYSNPKLYFPCRSTLVNNIQLGYHYTYFDCETICEFIATYIYIIASYTYHWPHVFTARLFLTNKQLFIIILIELQNLATSYKKIFTMCIIYKCSTGDQNFDWDFKLNKCNFLYKHRHCFIIMMDTIL